MRPEETFDGRALIGEQEYVDSAQPLHVRLLVEAYHALQNDCSRTGGFYRRSKHGLLHRIREALKDLGVIVADPPPRPTTNPSQEASRSAQRTVPGGQPVTDDSWADDPANGWRMEGGEA